VIVRLGTMTRQRCQAVALNDGRPNPNIRLLIAVKLIASPFGSIDRNSWMRKRRLKRQKYRSGLCRALRRQFNAAQARDDDKAIDLSVVEGLQETVVVLDRDAAV